MGKTLTISPKGAVVAAPFTAATSATDCRLGQAHPCRVDPPLIDPFETWKKADDGAKQFAARLGGLWKEGSGFAYAALTQAHFFKFLAAAVAAAALISCLVYFTLIENDWRYFVQGVEIVKIAFVLGGGVASFTTGQLIVHISFSESIKRKASDLSNSLQDQMRREIILTCGHLIASGIQRLDIGQDDSGARAEDCLKGVFLAWRRIQLIPYILKRDWPAFRNPNVFRRDKKEIRDWFRWTVALVSIGFISLGLFAGLYLHDAPMATACIAGEAAFIPAAILLRNYFRRRAFLLVAKIEEGLERHLISETEHRLWTEEIADFDPLPQVARKHREALNAFYDLMGRK
ncbi:MAG: hypothetical protein WD076_08730 [Parvularculaceae bacterium]